MSVSRLRLLVLIVAGSSALIAAQHWPVDAAGSAIFGATQRAQRPHAGAAPSSAAPASSPPPVSQPVMTSAALTPEAATEQAPQARSRSFDGARGDAFAVLNWLPPVPPAPPPAPRPAVTDAPPPPPAAPTLPPLPFVFVGMLEKGMARPQAFLAKGETLLVVAAGDLLDNKTYRIESLTPQEVVMTYLPLDTRQTLPVTGGTK